MTQKRLDIRDLPRDTLHFTGTLRTILVKLANYVRRYPKKAVYMVELLEVVTKHIKSNIKGADKAPEKPKVTVKDKLIALRLKASTVANLTDLASIAAKVKAVYPENATLAEAKALVDIKFETLIEKQ